MKILAVDDDPVILDLLPLALREHSYDDVTTALSGAAALQILEDANEPFDVLILDITMPEMDGITLCRRIRTIPAYRETTIIVLTANTDTHSIESAFAAGANDYITKPFDVQGLGIRVQLAERRMKDVFGSQSDGARDFGLFRGPKLNGLGPQDAFKISALKQHTDMFSLGNYLSQLARAKIDKTSIFAVQICDFEELFASSSDSELLCLLTEVGNAVVKASDRSRLLGAYSGAGIFVYSAPDDMKDEWPLIELNVCECLKSSLATKLPFLDGAPSVMIGRPFRPNSSKTNRVRPTFHRAISSVERRVLHA